jgi:glycosyltransferase involved in cell wall biosynthesis
LFYKAADLFVLSSLQEGFGRVYLEALIYDLPVIAHHHPVMQYVVGEAGVLTDLSREGNLTKAIETMLSTPVTSINRREYVRRKFDWKILANDYLNMFYRVTNGSFSM